MGSRKQAIQTRGHKQSAKNKNSANSLRNQKYYVYASVWASWSAWSFCTGKVQVRVRACNTVRGYSCPGANRETKPCENNRQSTEENAVVKSETNDFDVHDDPWAADRREAFRQLYTDYDAAPGVQSPKLSVKSSEEFRRLQSGSKKPLGLSTAEATKLNGPPRPVPARQHAAPKISGQPPSMTPELLYERKTAVDNGADDAKSTLTTTTASTTHAEIQSNSSNFDSSKFVDKNIKVKFVRHRDNQNVASTIDIHNSSASTEWATGPGKHIRRPIPTRPISTTLNPEIKFVSKLAEQSPSPLNMSPSSRGDHVQLSASVQQHFKTPIEGTPSLEALNTQKLRDPSVFSTNISSPIATIEEESIANALEESVSQTQHTTLTPSKLLDNKEKNKKTSLSFDYANSTKDLHNFSTKPPTIQRPSSIEVTKIVDKLAHDQLDGETKNEEKPLHDGEVNFETTKEQSTSTVKPTLAADTVRALEWMLKNMSKAAAKVATMPQLSTTTSLPSNTHPPNSENASLNDKGQRRALASKTLRNNGEAHSIENKNPDEQEREIVSQLQKLHSNMIEMETELKQLREIGLRPRFDEHAAITLNLVPKAPRTSLPREQPPSPANPRFLLDDFRLHNDAAQWSDFGSWGECFCGKRIRTRTCNYDPSSYSRGCVGQSYESEPCEGGRPCPAKTSHFDRHHSLVISTTRKPQITTRRLYFSTTGINSDRSDTFYPNPMPVAQFQRHRL
ncbi:hypothetical protein M3Y98_00165600 [Aphelenchoides besseyi]|nr:hypothetical protein M3Y98_00165600 [Aphelenchoides besseyi]